VPVSGVGRKRFPRSLSRRWSETDRERGGAVGGFLFRGQVGPGRAGCRERGQPVGGRIGVFFSRCTAVVHPTPPLGDGTGYERGTLCVRGDVLLWVALQASLMAERFTDGAGDADCGVGVSQLVGASHISEHAADSDLRLCRTGRSSCRR
jgi:hypothetical protein